MEGARDVAQSLVSVLVTDATTFPWFTAIIAVLVAAAVVWSTVEVVKATTLSGLKQKPEKGCSEESAVEVILSQFRWYLLIIWIITFVFGAASGFGVGAIDGFGEGSLGWWGIPFGLGGGILSKAIAQFARGFSDKASDVLLGWLKKRLGGKE